MPDSLDSPLRGTVKYNPHLWSDEELRAIFVVRQRELATALDRIRGCPPDQVPQHLLVIGYRGMGKTTLLRRIALAVAEDPKLAADWIPLTFPEEQYTVSTLAELWMNVLDALADQLERQGVAPDELVGLDTGIRRVEALPPAEREEAALGLLGDWTAERQRRLLLLIDSSDLLLANLGQTEGRRGRVVDAGATPLWRLRKTLSHDPIIFWLGASYQALEADHQYQDAFHDFFEILELRPLKLDEMRRALLALARTFGAGPGLRSEKAEQEMQRNLDAHPERLRSLRTLTGGNPRTTVILYELLAAGWEGDVHSDLKALLDLMTPLYKARMEQLAEQPRKLLALLMEHWDPIGAGDLARSAGLPPTTVSGQLNRLIVEGLVEKVSLAKTTRAGYQASERFFNIWYLMRYTPRRTRRRLTWLVEFMRLWFSADDLRRQARHSLDQLRGAHAKDWPLDHALALSDALPEDSEERRLLQEALNLPGKVEDSDWKVIPKNAWYWWFDLGNLLSGQDRPEKAEAAYRKAIELDPQNALSWHNLGILLQNHLNRPEEAESAFRTAIELDPKDARTWNNFGVLLADHLNRPEEAESAFRKASGLDLKFAWPWYNLGSLLRDLNRSEEAEIVFRKAIDLDPEDPYPFTNLGRLLAARGDSQGADAAYRRAGSLAAKHVGDRIGIGHAHLILQAQLWLGDSDTAGQALERLASAAAAGDKNALFRLQEQARECHAIGRGPVLADLLEASPHIELLRPVALALRAADQGPQALDGVAAEIRTMAEESLKDILR